MGFTEPIGKFFVAIGADTKEFRKEIASAQRTLKSALGKEAMSLSRDIALAMAGAATAVTAFGAASIAAAADEERNIRSMTTLLKSAEKAELVMKDIDKIGSISPIPIEEMEKAAQALVKMRIGAGDIGTTLQTLGDISAATKVPLEDIVSTYGKISANGLMTSKQLKEMMGQGIPIVQELANQLGKPEAEIRKLGKSGSITFEQVRSALQGMTAEGGRFSGGMAGAAETIIGKWNMMRNNLDIIMKDVGFSLIDALEIKPAMDRAAASMREFSGLVKDKGFLGAIDATLGTGLKMAILASAGALTGAMIPAIYSMGLAITASAAAMAVLVPMFKFGLAVAGVVALGAVIYKHAGDAKDFVIRCVRQVGYHFSELVIAAKMVAAGIAGVFAKMGAEILLSAVEAMDSIPWVDSSRAQSVRVAYASMIDSANGYKKTVAELSQEQKQNYADMQASWAGRSPWGTFTAAAAAARDAVMGVGAALNEGVLRMPDAPRGKVTASGGEDGSAKKLSRAVADATADIKREWLSVTQTKETQLRAWYQEEVSKLDALKGKYAQWDQDRGRLEETYTTKFRELATERVKDEWEKLQAANAKKAELAASAGDAMRRQIEEEAQDAERMADHIEAVRTGQAIEEQLWTDYRAGDLERYRQHLTEKNATLLANLQGQKEMMDVYGQMEAEAHRSGLSYMAEGYRTLYDGLSSSLVGVITGTKSAATAMKELGMQLITMVVKWMVQRALASAMAKTMEAGAAATSMATGAAVAAAWAPAAAMVSAATFGASAAAGAAGLGALNAFSRTLAIPGLASGGIVTRPTLAMIGEGHGPEAVIPLDRAGAIGGAANVTVNVHNNTGVQTQTRQQTTRNGQDVVVDLWLDAFTRDVNGLRTAVKGAI